MPTLEDITAKMLDVVLVNDTITTPSRFVVQAITQQYSIDRPRTMCTDVAGVGTSFVDLPQATEDDPAAFEPGFSQLTDVEFPIDDDCPSSLDPSDWTLRQIPSGTKLQIKGSKIAAEEFVRLFWTARHAEDGSTVLPSDVFAVADLAGALYMERLAAYYLDTSDSTISADTVNYRTKGQESLTLAKTLRKRYLDQMGTDADGDGSTEVAPAFSHLDMDNRLGNGGDRLTHGRRSR